MHKSVLLQESIEALNLKEGQVVVDGTTNRAGHSVLLAQKIGTTGTLICLDLDAEALAEAKIILQKNLKSEIKPLIFFVQDNFRNLRKILQDLKIKNVNAVLVDLGVSSQEIDESGRGFSFQKNEPLLMTFAFPIMAENLTAKEIVNEWSEENLADIIYYYGDEKYSKRIAKNLCAARKLKKIETTFDLVKIIENSVPAFYQKARLHFATKTFQALRIAVNDELKAEEDLLHSFSEILQDNGRASVITFHSGEDRIVKKFIKEKKIEQKVGQKNNFKLIKFNKNRIESKFGQDFLIPNNLEIKNNPRARSAKLRVIEKICD